MPSQPRSFPTLFSPKPFTTPLSFIVFVKSFCTPGDSPSASHQRSHASNCAVLVVSDIRRDFEYILERTRPAQNGVHR
jgi:hypothetical protein